MIEHGDEPIEDAAGINSADGEGSSPDHEQCTEASGVGQGDDERPWDDPVGCTKLPDQFHPFARKRSAQPASSAAPRGRAASSTIIRGEWIDGHLW